MQGSVPYRFSVFIFFVLVYMTSYSQGTIKNMEAVRTAIAPKIDGKLSEMEWMDAAPASDFTQYYPYNGAKPSEPTEVRILYDDRAIYVGAFMYDSHPDSIKQGLAERDDRNIDADIFTIIFLPYNDGLNAFDFKVSASGVEYDIRHAANYHDRNWDAIWDNAVKINDSGWVVEMEIPFAALRFPKTEIQEWGINIGRTIRRHKETSTWNHIDNKLDGFYSQSGTLSGIHNVKPPLRLFFIPYVAGYTENAAESDTWAYSYNYGLDMKLGLSESFTLDMTLIPDFGQVQSDDKVVNLSPFEVYYQERRPFFTEGTELFERGEIFYSRRVGGTPDGYNDIRNDHHTDSIISNPGEIQLVNATKVSGRNKNGTAIGVFNAVNTNTWARVIDTTGAEQKILTNPATNYNMIVFDQSLKNNSYVSIYNTNYYQGRDRYVANVSGTEFELRTANDMWAVGARANISQKYYPDDDPAFGHAYEFEAGKKSGNFRFAYSHETQNDTYDINDMGFNRRNNRFVNDINLEYNIYEPFGVVIEMMNEFLIEHEMLYEPRKFVSFSMGSFHRTTFKNHLTIGMHWDLTPVETHDYYEPRVDGRMMIYPANGYFGGFISPDYRKRFIVDANAGYWAGAEYGKSGYHVSLEPRFRVSDNFTVSMESDYEMDWNDTGHPYGSPADADTIIIGKRDIQILETILEAKYIFSKNTSLSLRGRHYWFSVDYDKFYELREDGYLDPSYYTGNHNLNANAFNIDMVFRWIFAPASELLFVWKNNISNEQDEVVRDYLENIHHTFTSPMGNSFSLKLLYYLDYQKLRKNRE
ncbi:MAG: DUF5916 domain-containing protein [Bacteroidota bacterium]